MPRTDDRLYLSLFADYYYRDVVYMVRTGRYPPDKTHGHVSHLLAVRRGLSDRGLFRCSRKLGP